MADRGPDQDTMHVGKRLAGVDPTHRRDTYFRSDEDDEEEVRDLGFIVEDHDDRRGTLTEGFQHLDGLDTNEPLETNRGGPIPHATSLRERGASREWFATDYHLDNAVAEAQEQDFVETSMLDTDPETNAGDGDFTDESFRDIHGLTSATDLTGHVRGVSRGFGTRTAHDLGSSGFGIEDNPLMQPRSHPISGEILGDEALGLRDVDEMGTDEELERLADRYLAEAELAASGE